LTQRDIYNRRRPLRLKTQFRGIKLSVRKNVFRGKYNVFLAAIEMGAALSYTTVINYLEGTDGKKNRHSDERRRLPGA